MVVENGTSPSGKTLLAESEEGYRFRQSLECRRCHLISIKSHRNIPCARERPRGGLENGLAKLWRRKKITKKAHAGRGQETKWEISGKTTKRYP
jgi:hypothetical protein